MPCILCQEEGDFRLRYVKNGYNIQTCSSCHLTQLNPPPSPEVVSSLYDSTYYDAMEDSSGYDDYNAQEIEYLATFREDVKRMRHFKPSGKVLDIGCGPGHFVKAALESGYDSYGVDIIPSIVEAACEELSGRVFAGTLDSVAELQSQKFDVIFASHVIEHILEPVSFVQTMRDRLTEGGVVVLITPNIASWLSRLSRSRWVSYKIPEHVAYYNPSTIRSLFDRSGMETLAVDSAYQHYRTPFIASKLRRLIHPLDKLIPRIEDAAFLKEKIFRITSGSLRAIAKRPKDANRDDPSSSG